MRESRFFFHARELTCGIPLVDYHIHTRYSDGRSSIWEYVEAAINKGYKSICFTDHADFTTTWYGDYSGEISRVGDDCKSLKIIRGMEVRARDREGSLNAPDELLDRAEIVIGVVHSIPSSDGKGKHSPGEFPREKLLELEYDISLSLLDNDRVSVLGHPMSNYEKLYGPVPWEYYAGLISRAKSVGKAIEISAKYKSDFGGFLRLCLDMDPLVSLGSDAHSVDEFGAVGVKLCKELA